MAATVKPINIVMLDHSITWDEANAAAWAAGGRLYLDKNPVNSRWLSDLGDAGDDSRLYEDPHWFGISANPSGGYRWVDGTAVGTLKFGVNGDPNADSDPYNDITHPVLSGTGWQSPSGPVSSYIIEYTNTSSIRGTSGDDFFFGGASKGETLSAGDGNDQYVGPGGGKISMGSGDDLVSLGQGTTSTPWTSPDIQDGTLILDGDGRDYVDAQGGVLRAAIDGDNDTFVNLTRVSYTDATTKIIAADGVVTGANGQDTLSNVIELVGGSGNDDLSGFARLQGGGGNDILKPGGLVNGTLSPNAYAEGGDGNDTLYSFNNPLVKSELRGEAGNDTFILSGGLAEVSGGPGNDTFKFISLGSTQVRINDLSPGDKIDLSGLPGLNIHDVQEGFDGGYFAVSKANGYTTLSVDTDGGGDELQSLAILKGNYDHVGDYILV